MYIDFLSILKSDYNFTHHISVYSFRIDTLYSALMSSAIGTMINRFLA